MYAIKINKTNLFVSHCDDCWYETSGYEPLFVYTKEEAEKIVQTLRKHYVYVTTIIEEKGESILNNFLLKTKPIIEAPKKSLLKFKVKI